MCKDEDTGRAPFDCGSCMDPGADVGYVEERVRASWHCGWMPKEDWAPGKADLPEAFGNTPYDCDVCPGWLVRQPIVTEIMQAHALAKLHLFNGDEAAEVVVEGVGEASRSIEAYQAWAMAEAKRKRESNG